jgi:hypothetical protein
MSIFLCLVAFSMEYPTISFYKASFAIALSHMTLGYMDMVVCYGTHGPGYLTRGTHRAWKCNTGECVYVWFKTIKSTEIKYKHLENRTTSITHRDTFIDMSWNISTCLNFCEKFWTFLVSGVSNMLGHIRAVCWTCVWHVSCNRTHAICVSDMPGKHVTRVNMCCFLANDLYSSPLTRNSFVLEYFSLVFIF